MEARTVDDGYLLISFDEPLEFFKSREDAVARAIHRSVVDTSGGDIPGSNPLYMVEAERFLPQNR